MAFCAAGLSSKDARGNDWSRSATERKTSLRRQGDRSTRFITMKIDLHPSLGDFDPLTEEERAKLKKSIKKHGCKIPVLIWKDRGRNWLMDGRHRYDICNEVQATYNVQFVEGTEEEAKKLARSLNEDRRHRPAYERAFAAAQEAVLPVGANQHEQSSANSQGKEGKEGAAAAVPSQEEAAIKHDVSVDSVQRAKTIIANGTPQLQALAQSGEVSLKDAAAVAKEPAKVQNAAVAAVKNGKAKTVKKAVTAIKGDADEGELEEILDAEGVAVPDDARSAFQGAKDIEALCRELDTIGKKIGDASKLHGWEMVNIDSVLQTLKNARQALWSSRATHVCPYCQGNNKGAKTCNCCKGRGWTIKTLWTQAPKT